VFVLSCFDPAIASRSPEKILTVGESSGGNSAKGKQARQSVTAEASESIGTGGEPFRMRAFGDYTDDDTASALKMRDYKDATDLIVEEPFTASSHAGYTAGVGTLRANGGDLGGGSETLLAFDTQIV
jgi:DNA (cytosine-5)-methyltransferase 1